MTQLDRIENLLLENQREIKNLSTEVTKLNKVLAYRSKKMNEEQTVEDLVKLNRLHKIWNSKK